MRLLNVQSRQLEEYFGDNIPPYAILSHTWSDSEVTFQDLAKPDHATKPAYAKIEGCCQQAIRDRLNYVWVDTCCIDKSSSAELSEAINSMYQWYKDSQVCYVYLTDVSYSDGPFSEDSQFRRSRWFTRGWTLQELLAPRKVWFFGKNWDGCLIKWNAEPRPPETEEHYRAQLSLLSNITGIPPGALLGSLDDYCAASRLGWAAERKTTRVEDAAYSLLGLLDVNMPLLYGEGRKAFTRLQEEILKTRYDDSILAAGYGLWTYEPQLRMGIRQLSLYKTPFTPPVLADSPSAFRHCRDFRAYRPHSSIDVPAWDKITAHSTWTNIGLLISLPLIFLDDETGVSLAILRHSPYGGVRLVIPLIALHNIAENHFCRLPGGNPFPISMSTLCAAWNGHSHKSKYLSPPKQHGVKQFYLRDVLFDYVASGIPPPLQEDMRLKVDCGEIIRKAGYVLGSFYPPAWRIDPYNPGCMFTSPGLGWGLLLFRKSSHAFIVGVQYGLVISIWFAFGIAEVDKATALEYALEKATIAELPQKMPVPQRHVLDFEEVDEDGSMRVKRRISLEGRQPTPVFRDGTLVVRFE
ncbi:hypothetical protein DL769_009913 [Monosporascus sp. CRB-8-3]|nr:hypothetical protein DL769_009913 [Monosporascus sp. CRB-8-3]